MELETKIKEIFVKNLGIKENEIKPDVSLGASLALDSTELVELNVALEKAFEIKIAKDEITKSSTFNDIINKIKEKVKPLANPCLRQAGLPAAGRRIANRLNVNEDN